MLTPLNTVAKLMKKSITLRVYGGQFTNSKTITTHQSQFQQLYKEQ